MAAKASAPPIVFHPDFNYPEDDVVLKTSDNVGFRVHSAILRRASTVFSDMLALAQSPSVPLPNGDIAIPLEESKEVVELGLSIVSSRPISPTSLSNHHSFRRVVLFCDKYGMNGALSMLEAYAQVASAGLEPKFLATFTYSLAREVGWTKLATDLILPCLEYDIAQSDALRLLEKGQAAA